ncbi:MAG: DUF3558 domain-containing protein [Pseudonocardia sp.]
MITIGNAHAPEPPHRRTARRAALAAALAAILLPVLTACGALPLPGLGPVFGTAKPALSDAPRVTDPRDLSAVPVCDLVPPAELARLGLDPASADDVVQKVDDVQYVEHCSYRSRDLLSGITLTSAHRLDPGGLDRLYLNREFMSVFVPETIDGFPAVRTELDDGGACDINVGVADDQVLISGFHDIPGYEGPSPCDNARALASAVLATLPPCADRPR